MDDSVSDGANVEKNEKVETEKKESYDELSELSDDSSYETIDTDSEDLDDEKVKYWDPETASAEIGLTLISIPTKQQQRSDSSQVVNEFSGRKEKLTVSKGSEIEVSSEEFKNGTGNVWYSAILEEENFDKRLSVRYLDPLLKKDYSPPLINSTVYHLIRPVPPSDLYPDVGFEKGDVIDAAYIGGWWCGLVVHAYNPQTYLVYLRYESGLMHFDRKYLRPHLVWKDDEWFRCQKQMKLSELEFCTGKCLEVRTEVDNLGYVWTPAIDIKGNDEDGTLLVKPKSLRNREDIFTEISVPLSESRPTHPGFGCHFYKIMDKVDALFESRWCPGVVSKVLDNWPEEYIVVLGPNKVSKKFAYYQLRFSREWSWELGDWITEEKGAGSEGNMSLTPGRMEKLSVSKGSEIEVCPDKFEKDLGYVWYCAILEENLANSKKKRLSVRYLDPLLKKDYSPPLATTTVHRLIRPVPPPDPFPEVGFEEGDAIEAVHIGGWWAGWVIKVLGNQRYLVYLRFEPGAIEIKRKDMRPRMIWKDDEWLHCEKQMKQLFKADFSPGKFVEVRTEVDKYGYVWSEATAIEENEDGTLHVKLKTLSNKEDIYTKMSLPYSKIRPPQPQPTFGYRPYKMMEKVDAYIKSRWCPGVVSQVPHGNLYHQYVVVLGPNKENKEFTYYQLRPSLEWKDGIWVSVTVPSALGEQKNTLAREKEVRATHYIYPSLFSFEENTPVTKQPEIRATIEFQSPVVLGIAAATLTKPVLKTPGKTSPGKNQKSSANDSNGEKGPEETTIREVVNKRKRGRPCKFISTEPKQKTGVAANDSKVATIELANMTDYNTDDNRPLASSGQSVSRSPDPMLNSVVEMHVDVVETTPAKESTMVLPFVKKSLIWKVLESMEVFRAVPQHPHFSPLLESEKESREGEAIGKMVMYTGLLEELKNLQVDHPISSIKRIDECLLKLEKHGFNVTEPRSRIARLLVIKERQTRTLGEYKAVEEKITESDNKRRKYEEDIVELQTEFQRREAVLKEAKVKLDTEIARMQSDAAVLDHKVQTVDQDFQAIVNTPW